MSGDRSRERRRLAAECLAVAKQTSDVGVRASLLEIAQKWLDLAELCEHDAWNEKLRLRAVQATIGKELRVHYELPQQLSHQLLALLMQLNEQENAD
jgi:transcriptional regulator with XRE-family HTH domain